MSSDNIISNQSSPIQLNRDQQIQVQPSDASKSFIQRQSTLIVYYFDFQCLPSTYDESLLFDANSIVNQQPPFLIEQYKVNEGQNVLINVQNMKRTKRAFNVYKCCLDVNCQIIKIRQIEKNQKNFQEQNTQIDANEHQEQQKQIDDLDQHKTSQKQEQKKEGGTHTVFSNQAQINPFSSTQVNEQKQDSKLHEYKEKERATIQSQYEFEELTFENPYYNQQNQMNSNNINNVNRLVIYNKELIEVEYRSNKKSLIITTDLGGTLCGIPEATIQFMKIWIKYFWFDKSCRLIYNSGRGIHPFNLLMKKESVILPDYYIGRCGSFIYLKDYTKGILYQDKQWLSELGKIWQPKIIFEKMQKLSGWLKYKVRNDPEVWSLRYNSEINEFYQREDEFKQIEKELSEIGIEFNAIIREKQNLMHLEIVPSITDKGLALEYLLHKVYYPYIHKKNQKIVFEEDITGQQRLQEEQQRNMSKKLEFIQNKIQQIKSRQFNYQDILINNQDNDIVIAAFGDTMNDDGMLKLANFSICVSNSEQQLIQWANSHQQQTHPQLYVSQHSNGYALLEFVKQYIN